MVDQQGYRDTGMPAAAVPLIDLDLAGPPDVAPPRRPVGRSAKAAFLALVVVFGLSAAAAPRAGISRLLTVGTTPASARVLSADALFVTDFSDGQADDSIVRRYALDDGAPLWSSRLPESARGLLLQAGAHVLLTRNADESTTALDADTGAVLWRDAGGVSELTADAALVVQYSEDRRAAVLRLMSLRDGTEVWARPVGRNATWRVLGDPARQAAPGRLVIIAETGVATTLRFDTGTVVTEAALNLQLREWEGNYREDYLDDFTEITGTGDSLYVVTGHDGTAALTAYDADTLTVRWRTAGVPPGRAEPCGQVLCVADLSVLGSDPGTVEAGRELAAIDPRTGARRWSGSGWLTTAAVSADRLIVTTASGDAGQPHWSLLDAATGRVVTELGAGQPLTNPAGDLRFLRLDSVRPQRAWVSTVDLRTGRSVLAGPIDRATQACDAVGANLACAVLGGPFTVWRLP